MMTKKSAAGSCGITFLPGLSFTQLSDTDWLKHRCVESDVLPIRFVSITYSQSIWMFLHIFQHSCDGCILQGEEVNVFP